MIWTKPFSFHHCAILRKFPLYKKEHPPKWTTFAKNQIKRGRGSQGKPMGIWIDTCGVVYARKSWEPKKEDERNLTWFCSPKRKREDMNDWWSWRRLKLLVNLEEKFRRCENVPLCQRRDGRKQQRFGIWTLIQTNTKKEENSEIYWNRDAH